MHDSKTKFIEAAIECVRAAGVDATTVDVVCERAGLGKGSFFHHFQNKHELLLAAIDHWNGSATAMFGKACFQNSTDPLERFIGYLRFRREILAGSPGEFSCLLGTTVQETYQSHPLLRRACEAGLQLHVDTLTPDIEAAKLLFAPDATWSAESLAYHTQAVLQGAFILAKASGSPEVARRCIDHLIAYVEGQFRRPEPATAH